MLLLIRFLFSKKMKAQRTKGGPVRLTKNHPPRNEKQNQKKKANNDLKERNYRFPNANKNITDNIVKDNG